MNRNNAIPNDIKEILDIISAGRLFDLQKLISEGRRLCCKDIDGKADCCLKRACMTGFHSLIELVLKNGKWTQEELDDALNMVLENKRKDLAELLLSAGASPKSANFEYVASIVDYDFIEKFFKAGCPPERENGFAIALDNVKARPLLRFLKTYKERFPELEKQASLALKCAVTEGNTGWAALLMWAGADPLMEVPDGLYEDWKHCYSSTAQIACIRGHPEMIKVLKLKPSTEEILDLFDCAVVRNNLEALEMLVKTLPKANLRKALIPHCETISSFIEKEIRLSWNSTNCFSNDDIIRRVKCLQVLLEAGAQWNPPEESLQKMRKRFMKLPVEYMVRVIRMLLYVPNAVDRSVVLKFCNTPLLRAIGAKDEELWGEILDMERATS